MPRPMHPDRQYQSTSHLRHHRRQSCLPGNEHTYTSTVSPAGGTVTHSWTISGNGTIQGGTTGASVTVVATAAGSFTLTDTITREGCPGQCQQTITVNPNPTCD